MSTQARHIVLPLPDTGATAVLSGALVDLALLPPCTSAADANLRIRAAMIAEGDPVSRLVLIASIAVQGIIAEDQEPPPGMPLFEHAKIIPFPLAAR